MSCCCHHHHCCPPPVYPVHPWTYPMPQPYINPSLPYMPPVWYGSSTAGSQSASATSNKFTINS